VDEWESEVAKRRSKNNLCLLQLFVPLLNEPAITKFMLLASLVYLTPSLFTGTAFAI
jgi:hypothetical protein